MARVTFNPMEIDSNFQIEDAVRKELETDASAKLDISVLDSNYDCLDDDGEICPNAGLEAKCKQIAESQDLEFKIDQPVVIFQKKNN